MRLSVVNVPSPTIPFVAKSWAQRLFGPDQSLMCCKFKGRGPIAIAGQA